VRRGLETLTNCTHTCVDVVFAKGVSLHRITFILVQGCVGVGLPSLSVLMGMSLGNVTDIGLI